MHDFKEISALCTPASVAYQSRELLNVLLHVGKQGLAGSRVLEGAFSRHGMAARRGRGPTRGAPEEG